MNEQKITKEISTKERVVKSFGDKVVKMAGPGPLCPMFGLCEPKYPLELLKEDSE